jgi:hypothetical protein
LGGGPPTRLKVLFICGYARSGSTLLGQVLGETDAFVDVGELGWVWEKGFRDNTTCGCGTPFRRCEFWNAVAEKAFGNMRWPELSRIIGARQRVDRWWRALPSVSTAAERRHDPDLRLYVEALRSLLLAIQRVSGCSVIVDSTKTASHGLLLNQLGSPIELHPLHLVRDAQATVYSLYRRAKWNPSETKRVRRQGVVKSCIGWTGSNLFAERLQRVNEQYRLLRYDEFLRDPPGVSHAILELIGEAGRRLPFINDREVILSAHHSIAGNPIRFQTGAVPIRMDEERIGSMGLAAQMTVAILTWPVQGRYWGRTPRSLLRPGSSAEAGT